MHCCKFFEITLTVKLLFNLFTNYLPSMQECYMKIQLIIEDEVIIAV